MAKKVVYKPGKGAFNLDEKKSLSPYGANREQKSKKDKKGKK